MKTYPQIDRFRFIRAAIVVCLIHCGLAIPWSGAAPVPPTDNTSPPYMGVFGSSLNQGAVVAPWLNRSGLWTETFLDFSSWANLEGPNWALNPAVTWLAANPNGKIVLTVGMLPGSGNTPLAGTSLALGATGTYNSHYQKLAQNLVTKGLANNTIVRLGHEFTGFWYPWCPVTSAKAASYATYWQQIVTTMKAVPGAENLKFDWNGATQWTEYPLATAYPGDAYVDYIGTDIYDACYAANTYPYASGATPAQILAAQTTAWSYLSSTTGNGLGAFRNFAIAHGKPMSIPEWGVCDGGDGHGGLDDPAFIQRMYNFIQDPANNVGYHSYFDYSAPDSNHAISCAGTHFPNSAALFRKLFGITALPVNNDIGVVGISGSSDLVTVYGAGAGCLTGTSDNFHFAARNTTGDEVFITQIVSMSSDPAAQSGVMLRESAAEGAPYAGVFLSNGSCAFQSRLTSGGVAVQSTPAEAVTFPVWLKLIRRGNVISGYKSEDGLNWTIAGRQTVSMASSAYVGVAVSSGSTTGANVTSIEVEDDFGIALADTPSISNALVLDSASATGVTRMGTWVSSTSSTGYYGTDYMHDGNTNKGGCSVTFTPTLATAGMYDVYTCWTAYSNRATNTPIAVTATDGVYQQIANQQVAGSRWNYLGTYSFASGTTGQVTISNSATDGYVIVDAVMFVPVPEPSLPSPKVDTDIGAPALPGSALCVGGVYSVIAGGAGISGTSDQFNYVNQPLTGYQTLIARVTGITNSSVNAKAGVMIRGGLTGDAASVMMSISYNGYAQLIYRTSPGAAAVAVYPTKTGITPSSATPVWVKLVKSGGNYNGYYATTLTTPTASDWHACGSLYLTFTNYYGGLAVSSCNTGATTTATIDNVTP